MDQEEYFKRFFQYMRCSEDNESIFPQTIRSKVDQIYSMYGKEEPSEADIQRDANVFLLGMEARGRMVVEIDAMEISTKMLEGLLKRIERGYEAVRTGKIPQYRRVSVNPGQD